MARDKALYEGHAVAAVAATTQAIAEEALELIEVKYEVLPYVIDVEDGDGAGRAGPARRPVHRGRRAEADQAVQHRQGASPSRKATSKPASRKPKSIVEGRYTTQPVHQAYIEPHACLSRPTAPTARCTIYSSSQGHFMVRAYTRQAARHRHRQHPRDAGRDRRRLRRQDAGLPGAGGGRAVEEVRPSGQDADDAARRCSAPPARPRARRSRSSSAPRRTAPSSRRKQVLKYQAGAFPGSPIGPGCMCGFAMYDMPNVDVVGYDVVSNRPKVAAYRAPGAPIYVVRRRKRDRRAGAQAGHGPADAAREERGARTAPRRITGRRISNIGFEQTLAAAKNHPHWKAPLQAQPGPRHRLRLLVQHRRRIDRRRCMSTRTAR